MIIDKLMDERNTGQQATQMPMDSGCMGAYAPTPSCDVPLGLEYRQRLESRKYQLHREIEQVEWALNKLESQEVQDGLRFQEIMNRATRSL